MMKTELDAAERDFLEQLHRLGAGTVQEIGEALNVTATAVRQRLVRLQDAGLVTREVERVGRGRPHHRYRLTEKALRVLGDNYSDLAMILWQEIQHITDPEIRDRLLARIRDAMVARFGKVGGGSLVQKMEQLRSELVERGYDVDVDLAGSLPILRENNCPFHELAETDREICELEQQVFERVLGAPLRLTNCCRDSHHCCEFEVGAAGTAQGAASSG